MSIQPLATSTKPIQQMFRYFRESGGPTDRPTERPTLQPPRAILADYGNHHPQCQFTATGPDLHETLKRDFTQSGPTISSYTWTTNKLQCYYSVFMLIEMYRACINVFMGVTAGLKYARSAVSPSIHQLHL